ncbi:glycosyltransferase 87 family protein [Streptomyces lydicus]|uniref:glycosyltransferase 87 family protein n=1 Tax=Streptomyces lydicus TaxID=47763 RepID=UPI0036E23C53
MNPELTAHTSRLERHTSHISHVWRTQDWIVLGLCTVLALIVFLSSPPHTAQRLWGWEAALGYLCGAVVATVIARPWARLTAVVTAVGALVLPFLSLVLMGKAQIEIKVLERAGELLLSSGSPYAPNPTAVRDFNPYLPGMAIFALPHALFGDHFFTDPRWWFAASLIAAVVGATRVARAGKKMQAETKGVTGVFWLLACPPLALALAIGGVDPAVIGLLCLGLSHAGQGNAGRAGLALGAAAALKWTAWPALPVAIALLAALGGKRSAGRCTAAASGVVMLVIVPVFLVNPAAFVEHVVLFPLGLGKAPSPAASPLPGHLLAAYLPGGTAIAMTLLGLSAAAIGASLFLRPPTHALAAANRLALGLTLAILFAPATRIGYLVFPIVLMGWFRFVPFAPRLPVSAAVTSPGAISLYCTRSTLRSLGSVGGRQERSPSDLTQRRPRTYPTR